MSTEDAAQYACRLDDHECSHQVSHDTNMAQALATCHPICFCPNVSWQQSKQTETSGNAKQKEIPVFLYPILCPTTNIDRYRMVISTVIKHNFFSVNVHKISAMPTS